MRSEKVLVHIRSISMIERTTATAVLVDIRLKFSFSLHQRHDDTAPLASGGTFGSISPIAHPGAECNQFCIHSNGMLPPSAITKRVQVSSTPKARSGAAAGRSGRCLRQGLER